MWGGGQTICWVERSRRVEFSSFLIRKEKKLKKNKRTTHLPVSASGRNSKQGRTANTLTFHVKFYHLIWKMQDRSWMWTETPAPVAHDAAQFCCHWRKNNTATGALLCVSVALTQQGLRCKLLLFAASLCFLSLLHPDCYRGPTIQSYLPFSPNTDHPLKKKREKTTYLL